MNPAPGASFQRGRGQGGTARRSIQLVNDDSFPVPRERGRRPRRGEGRGRDFVNNTYGHIPNIGIGTKFVNRLDCSRTKVHPPTRAGIHGNKASGAISVVLSGGYEDEDYGTWFYYMGTGKDDQNPEHNHNGWLITSADEVDPKRRKPVRVIRGGGGSKYSPQDGYRYDGLYMVTSYTTVVDDNGKEKLKFKFEGVPGETYHTVEPEKERPAAPPGGGGRAGEPTGNASSSRS